MAPASGLATVLSIVRKHGGQIGVGSELAWARCSPSFLPVADKPVEVQARRAPSLRFGTGRVLFMDDDPTICALTAAMLQSLDYKFDIARNGEEAVKFYRSYFNIGRPYDAVIMDITVIGGMGGERLSTCSRRSIPTCAPSCRAATTTRTWPAASSTLLEATSRNPTAWDREARSRKRRAMSSLS